ncbi:hypothetical protein P4S72_15190 [Vibrio sp. PP-XX7]
MWDLAEDKHSIQLIEDAMGAHKPVALVCHAPGVLRHVKNTQGEPLVSGKSVTGFSNTEEAAVELTDVVPFLVEDMLKANGGNYSKAGDWNLMLCVMAYSSRDKTQDLQLKRQKHCLIRLVIKFCDNHKFLLAATN